MKPKIEITQADILKLLVHKIEFLSTEYESLYSVYQYIGKGKTKIDPIKIEESHNRYLTEKGDINRLLTLFRSFEDNITVKDKDK